MSNFIHHEGRMSVTDLAALLVTPPLPTPAQRAAFASALTAHGGYRLSDPHIQHAAAEACGQEGADALSPQAQTLADLSWRLMRRSGFRIVEADGTIVYYAGHVVRAAAELAALSDDDIMSLVVGAVPQVGEALDSTVRGVAEPEHGPPPPRAHHARDRADIRARSARLKGGVQRVARGGGHRAPPGFHAQSARENRPPHRPQRQARAGTPVAESPASRDGP